MENNIVDIQPYGLHTCRYNSLIRASLSQDIALYVLGNKIVIYNFETKEKKLFKISQDGLMVVKQSTTERENRFVACTYDGHIIVFSVDAKLDLQIESD
jgi:hypothetical protein